MSDSDLNSENERLKQRLERQTTARRAAEELLNSKASELYLLNQNLLTAKEAAEAASLAKSEFLANMNHELRTPLNAIIGYSDMLIEDFEDDPAVCDDLNKIRNAGKRLLTMISEILDLAKLDAGRVKVDIKPLTFSALANQLQGRENDLVAPNNNELIIDDQLGEIEFQTDHDSLLQILLNLLGNAGKFTENGTVTISARIDNNLSQPIIIEVADTGIGIDLPESRDLFNQFVQADSSNTRQHAGMGLGLKIAFERTSLIQGSIGVESELGKGAVFRVCLPLVMNADK